MPSRNLRVGVIAVVIVSLILIPVISFSYIVPAPPHMGFVSESEARSITNVPFNTILYRNESGGNYPNATSTEAVTYSAPNNYSFELIIDVVQFSSSQSATNVYDQQTNGWASGKGLQASINNSFERFTYSSLRINSTTAFGIIGDYISYGHDESMLFLVHTRIEVSFQTLGKLVMAQISSMVSLPVFSLQLQHTENL